MNKPQIIFVGRISGVILCECGKEMEKIGDYYKCNDSSCAQRGKTCVAIPSNFVLFYEVVPT